MRVVNNYANEAKEPQSTRLNMLFKYTPKDKRNAGQKALTPVREIVNFVSHIIFFLSGELTSQCLKKTWS